MERDFLLLILFSVVSLFGGDAFWFSYRSVTSKQALIYEEKNISPLMIEKDFEKSFTCKVKLKNLSSETALERLNDNFYDILPCFYRVAVKVTSQSENSIYNQNDTTEMIITPTRFIVDFKDDFANITVLN